MVGCTTPVAQYVPPLRNARMLEPLRTSDPEIIRQRFGSLGLAAGRAFGYRSSRVNSVLFYRWQVEGASLIEENLKCANYLIGDASCDTYTELFYFNEAQQALVVQKGGEAIALGKVQPNGAILVDRPGYGDYTLSFNPETGALKMGSALIDADFHALNAEQLAAMREEQAHFLANLQKGKSDSSAFWANLSGAVLAGAQTYASERQAAPPAYTPPPEPSSASSSTSSAQGRASSRAQRASTSSSTATTGRSSSANRRGRDADSTAQRPGAAGSSAGRSSGLALTVDDSAQRERREADAREKKMEEDTKRYHEEHSTAYYLQCMTLAGENAAARAYLSTVKQMKTYRMFVQDDDDFGRKVGAAYGVRGSENRCAAELSAKALAHWREAFTTIRGNENHRESRYPVVQTRIDPPFHFKD